MSRPAAAGFHMKLFRKLIRDNMPEILAKEGKKIKTRILKEDAEYFEWLRRKMLEELQEISEQPDNKIFLTERFAYLDEILSLLAEIKGVGKGEIKEAQKRIIRERGSFKKRLLLEL